MVPIFIGGCGRSGTTLLGAVLGAHSDAVCVPESPFKTDAVRRPELASKPVADLMHFILNTRRLRLWGLDVATLRQSAATLDATYPEALEWLVREYGRSVGRSAAYVWVDHTPENMRFAALLAELFPAAKFIHIVRDGRGVAASVLPLDWGPSTVDRAAQWWLAALGYGLAAETWGGPTRLLRVQYESLVLEPERTVRRICAFAGLDFEPAMLRADGFKVPGYTSQQHALVGSAPQANRVNAWQHELSARQIEIFESVAGEMLRMLGYDLQFHGRAQKPTRPEQLAMRMHDLYTDKIANRIRLQRRRSLAN
jgi:hypothetical protein